MTAPINHNLPPACRGMHEMLVFPCKGRYAQVMLRDVLHRFSAVLLILSLALGPALNVVHASSMETKMVLAAASDMSSPGKMMPSSGKCDDCAGAKAGMPLGACSVYCAGVAAVPPVVAPFDYLAIEAQGFAAMRPIAGQHVPPDPDPPRSIVLS